MPPLAMMLSLNVEFPPEAMVLAESYYAKKVQQDKYAAPHAEIPGCPGIWRAEWPKTASSTFRATAKLWQGTWLGAPLSYPYSQLGVIRKKQLELHSVPPSG